MTQTLQPPPTPFRASTGSPEPSEVPPLRDGDRLDQPEFHRRYLAMPPGCRAELIEGLVYLYDDGNGESMASPVSLSAHGKPHLYASGWIFTYCVKTPGLVTGNDSSILLDTKNEPQPDTLLGIPTELGGRTRERMKNDKTYLDGAPELILEVSAATARTDLNQKLEAYHRNGVREYVVILTDRRPAEVHWFDFAAGERAQLGHDDGVFRSKVFPGLWLDADALLAGDLTRLVAVLEQGLATAEHAAFVERLNAAARTRAK